MMHPALFFLTVAVLVLNALWHGLAGLLFTFRPRQTIARFTSEPQAGPISTELMRFLGALNLAITVICFVAIARPASARSLTVLFLFLANLSQFIVDLRVRRLGLTNARFDRTILAGDGLFAALNLGTFIALLLR